MAFADFDAYREALRNPNETVQWYRHINNDSIGDSGILNTFYLSPGFEAVPTSSVVPPRTRHCFPNQSGDRVIVRAANHRRGDNSSGASGRWTNDVKIVVDRLVHSGGLVGNVTTPQTTNLPSTALTRYTSGVGVYAAFQPLTAFGSTNSVATISYTNSDGTPGQTASRNFVGTPNAGTYYIFPVAAGDRGVKSIESFTLSISTGTAGNGSLVLFKPLVILPTTYMTNMQLTIEDIVGWNNTVENGACIDVLSTNRLGGQQGLGVTLDLAAF